MSPIPSENLLRRCVFSGLLLAFGTALALARSCPPSLVPGSLQADVRERALYERAREVRRLEGTWAATAGEYGGKCWPPAKVLKFRMTFKEGQYTACCGERMESGRYELAPPSGTKAIDLLPARGPQAGKTIPAIYQLEADRLMLCLAAPDEERPTEFSAAEGSEHILIVLRKETDAERKERER